MCENRQAGLARCKVNGKALKSCFFSCADCPSWKSPLNTSQGRDAQLAKLLSFAPSPHQKMKRIKWGSQEIFKMGGSSPGCLLPLTPAVWAGWLFHVSLMRQRSWWHYGELVHMGGNSLPFESEEWYLLSSHAQSLNFFLSFYYFFSSIFLCVPATPLSIYMLALGFFKIAKEAETTPSFYLCFQKNANQETQP